MSDPQIKRHVPAKEKSDAWLEKAPWKPAPKVEDEEALWREVEGVFTTGIELDYSTDAIMKLLRQDFTIKRKP